MSDTFITLAYFADARQAHSALSRLREVGLSAFLTGEMTAATLFGYAGQGPHIQLFVAQADSKRAADILSSHEEQAMPAGWEDDFPTEEGYWICSQCDEAIEDAADICPWCKSPRNERDAFDSP